MAWSTFCSCSDSGTGQPPLHDRHLVGRTDASKSSNDDSLAADVLLISHVTVTVSLKDMSARGATPESGTEPKRQQTVMYARHHGLPAADRVDSRPERTFTTVPRQGMRPVVAIRTGSDVRTRCAASSSGRRSARVLLRSPNRPARRGSPRVVRTPPAGRGRPSRRRPEPHRRRPRRTSALHRGREPASRGAPHRRRTGAARSTARSASRQPCSGAPSSRLDRCAARRRPGPRPAPRPAGSGPAPAPARRTGPGRWRTCSLPDVGGVARVRDAGDRGEVGEPDLDAHRAAHHAAARTRAAVRSASRSSSRWITAGSSTSVAKVSSWPMVFSGSSGRPAASSRPQASSCRCPPAAAAERPPQRLRRGVRDVADGAQAQPREGLLGRRPPPTGRRPAAGAGSPSTSAGRTTSSPSGLAWVEASLATNLVPPRRPSR